MERFETLMDFLEYAMDSEKKRHIIGGTLMSVSLLFGGLAFTVITMSEKKEIKK